MAHLRKIDAPPTVIDRRTGAERPATSEELAQLGLVHIEGDVYDCARSRSRAYFGRVFRGDMPKGGRMIGRHERGNVPRSNLFLGERD
jgi:hypothetical protein